LRNFALIALCFATAAAAEEPLPGLFSASDYPSEALERGEQGPVTVELAIDAQGRVTNCKVLVSAGWSLDRATCKAYLKRARFRPATDDNKKPIPSTYTMTMVWQIPGVRPQRPKPNTTRM
jgi:protein TonB